MAFARIIEISLSSVALLPRERIVAITCDRMAFVKTSAIWPAIVSLHLENVNNLSARVTEGGFCLAISVLPVNESNDSFGGWIGWHGSEINNPARGRCRRVERGVSKIFCARLLKQHNACSGRVKNANVIFWGGHLSPPVR